MKNQLCLVFLISALILCSLGCCLNTNSADYLKTIYAAKEGYDGISVYFILADKGGLSTTSDGILDLTITDSKTSRVLYTKTVKVTESDFQETSLGVGAFAHNDVIYYFGRIPYSEMDNVPDGEYDKGIVSVIFTTPEGKMLTGKESVYLN